MPVRNATGHEGARGVAALAKYCGCDAVHRRESDRAAQRSPAIEERPSRCSRTGVRQTRRLRMADVNDLTDVFMLTLRRVYDAEKRLVNALPKLAKSASSPELKEAFSHHLGETKTHVQRVEQIFGLLGERPNADTDNAAKGIVKAGDGVIALNGDGPVKDAALIAAAQEAEHYEIAAYGTLRTWAAVLDKPEAVRLLESTLMEEKRADQTLTNIASGLNTHAAAAAH
jgi:ferritin-like metal-binding protein YciE